ncbi:MAG: ATP-binding protein [Syntrophobacteraceae bacterium]
MEKKPITDPELLREQYHIQHQELQTLFDITTAIHDSPHLKDVLQQALMTILRTLNFKFGATYLVQEVQENEWQFELVAQHGFASAYAPFIHTLPVASDVMNRYRKERRAKWIATDKIVFPQLRERLIRENISEIICIPLMSHKRVSGMMYVTNNGVLPLRPERSEFLVAIGNQIGVAIENARLFDTLERAKIELEIMFDAIQHRIFLIDTKSRVYRVNKTSEEVYGKARDIIGKSYARVIYGQDEPFSDCPIKMCMEESRPVQREGAHPRWGGVYHLYAFPVLNLSGVLERVVYYEKDITESKKLEQRLQQTERLKALGTLAAGIAHEIRNPLATINFNAQMLLRELTLDPVQQQMFEDMVQQARRIDGIVQQVLHFARPREPQFLPNQINDVVKYCYDLSKVYLRKAHVDLTLDLADDLPLVIMDFNQVSQVIMNLVINAIEAMPNGGKLKIQTALQNTDTPSIVLLVSDTGPGILEEDRDRIFDPFFTRKTEGTGLGLSISRQIIEKHGAYLELDSTPGEGTTFRITYPLPPDSPRKKA